MGNNYCERFWNEFLRNDRNEYENIYLKLKTTLYLIHKNILMLNHITPYTNTVSNSLRYPLEQIYYNGNWQFIPKFANNSFHFGQVLWVFAFHLILHYPPNIFHWI